jgi:tRNA threonylcarbamoyladenosine biosynthesis protein TsaB
MKILAIEASAVAGSVAYIKDYELVGEYYICHKLTHSQTIMPMLEHLKELIEIPLEELDAIAVTSGPGSFTGLRIGVATAKAMAMALGIPIVGIPTLDVIAAGVPFTPHFVCPIMDARRDQVYTSLYKWEQEELSRKEDYEALEIGALLEKIKAQLEPKDSVEEMTSTQKVIFLGDGVKVFKNRIKEELGEKALFAPSHCKLQRASVLAHLACTCFEKGETVDADLFLPFYLRKSQAEREKEEREQSANKTSNP